jgi:nitroreductase/dihydropteridine reductase
MELLENLKWRYATKKMNGQKVPQEKVDYILEAARLAPTSAGLQPFKIFVITNRELLESIKAVAFNQTQITDCSHLLVFAAWDNFTAEKINAALDHANKERDLPHDFTDDYKGRLLQMFSALTEEEHYHSAAKQAFIAFGVAIAAAAEQKVDATPMEGFNKAALDELLGFKEKGFRSVVLLPLGYRDESNDWLVNMKKVRRPLSEFVTELN